MFTARSALTMLAKSPNGSTEPLMLAYGYPAELITKLVEAGFATATTERVIAGNRHRLPAVLLVTIANEPRGADTQLSAPLSCAARGVRLVPECGVCPEGRECTAGSGPVRSGPVRNQCDELPLCEDLTPVFAG